MLKKEQISKIKIYSDEWHLFRIGKMTSSKWHTQMGDKPLTEAALTYLYHKVGEELTGQSTSLDEQVEDENTIWGITNEPKALDLFSKVMQVRFITNQNIIVSLDGRFSSTPDAIWVHNESSNQQEYNVSSIEVKCPRKYHTYIPLFRCKTPAQLKAFNKNYYWQTIDQMFLCDSAVGYFMCFHPLFPPPGNYNIIEFRKIDLWDDFKLMVQRKRLALDKFDEIKREMLSTS